MQIEVKLTIDSAEGYERAALGLANHHLKDECYYDVFFDFGYRALLERDSVLRLRVPCEPQSVADTHAAAALTSSEAHAGNGVETTAAAAAAKETPEETTGTNGRESGGSSSATGGYDPDAEYDAFMRACRGQSFDGAAAKAQLYPDGSGLPTNLSMPSTSAATASRSRQLCGLPQPLFVAGATGRLYLKQKNTVQHGHQMTFVAEDADVPADVVEALVGLVPRSLFTTGRVLSSPSGPAPSDTAANAFTILTAYAQRNPRTANGADDSPIARIVAQLSRIARAYTPAEPTGFVGKRARSSSQESDAHFTQVRFSGMSARTTYTQRQLATSELTEEEEEEQRRSASSPAVPQLEAVGGFLTRRQLYDYTGVRQGISASSSSATPTEAELREGRRVRLDTSFLLPGFAIYELEVPGCGVAVDDIAEEVSTLLKKLAVRFHTGTESKYARYVHYLDATHDVEQDAMDVKLRLTNVNGYEEVRRNLQRLTQPAATSSLTAADAPHSSQEKRYVSNTEVDDADAQNGDDDTWWQTNSDGCLQETHEDFFFDSAEQTLRRGKTFLRLRKLRHLDKFVLVLKAHQVFSGGQQNSLSSKLELSAVVAHALIDNPTQFLSDHRENFTLMKTIWEEFGVRELCRTATFTTERLTVPWWSSLTQPATLQRSWAGGSSPNRSSMAPQSQPIYTSQSFLLSQQQKRLRCEPGESGSAKQPPLVSPLLIHLDKTLYKLPSDVKAVRAPFSQARPWADRQSDIYEIEVTNIQSLTEPKEVIRELTSLLNSLGVEWTIGVRSKLEQYFALIDA